MHDRTCVCLPFASIIATFYDLREYTYNLTTAFLIGVVFICIEGRFAVKFDKIFDNKLRLSVGNSVAGTDLLYQ